MKKRSRLRTGLEYAAARFVLATLSYGPVAFSERLARVYTGLLDRAIPRLRRVAMRNLALALPSLDSAEHARIASASFHSIARILVSMARFPRIGKSNVRQWIGYDGFEHYERALEAGKGVLFATAHLGNWELSAFAHALMAKPMHIVVRALDNPRIDAMVTRLRGASGNHVIEKRDFARGILRALSRNEAVGILIDQNAALDEGLFIDFFGVKACVSGGIARIAARTGATVIPGFALWYDAESRYVLKFYPPVAITGDEAEDTRRIHATLEAAIREYPDQWLWMHRRWKTRPPGEPPIYT
ncbi:MAG: lysophospholipid acyltransferase family protein [Bryobacteraceae bacterium]